MVHAEVVGVNHQQACRRGIAQALLHSLFLDRRFWDRPVFECLGAALRQADNEGQDYKTHSVFHDLGLGLHQILSNSAGFLSSPKFGKNRFNTSVFSLTEYLLRIEFEKIFVCHE
jgi:hypothetical protein